MLLAVDDDPAFRAVLRPLLEQIADRVVEVHDGTEAYAAIRRTRPDAVVLDLHLGDTDGHDVLAALRADPELTHLPVVVVTSATLTAAERARLSHARDVLPKTGLTATRLATALAAPPHRRTPPEDGP
ncbi:response regulator [Kitasatospora cheerisanensis]|uniref:response regulator n=1 Tax=Kitasatospora cheerisanensis TaxID=81942 RepID=UPI001FCBA579|nr:response regulator [Kitasatospora cheerisanensis]